MGEDNVRLTEGTFYYINGEEIGPGIPDFECSTVDLRDEVHKNMRLSVDPSGSLSFTVRLRNYIDKIFCAKMLGLYQWVCDNCPNRKVIHLMKYGKNKRVKNKNFIRALNITCRYAIEKGE